VEGAADIDESLITGRVQSSTEGSRRHSYCGNSCQWRKPARPHYGNRGPDCSLWNHEARRRCAGFRLSHASSRLKRSSAKPSAGARPNYQPRNSRRCLVGEQRPSWKARASRSADRAS
jgi:hypothetical protein